MAFLNPVIWMLGVVNFTIHAVRVLIADWGPTMLQEAKGFDPGSTGTVIMLFEFAGITGMLFAGWATDRFFGKEAVGVEEPFYRIQRGQLVHGRSFRRDSRSAGFSRIPLKPAAA